MKEKTRELAELHEQMIPGDYRWVPEATLGWDSPLEKWRLRDRYLGATYEINQESIHGPLVHRTTCGPLKYHAEHTYAGTFIARLFRAEMASRRETGMESVGFCGLCTVEMEPNWKL